MIIVHPAWRLRFVRVEKRLGIVDRRPYSVQAYSEKLGKWVHLGYVSSTKNAIGEMISVGEG